MHRTLKISVGLFLMALALPLANAADTWTVDGAHSSAHFKIRHMMVSNVGGDIAFSKGTFTLDDKDATKLKAEATLDVNTINTNNAKRDEHLKSADFFDTGKFPTITFKSKKVTKDGDKLKVVGDFTMHGVTKEVTLEGVELTPATKDAMGGMRRGFSGTTKINRKDFGLSWNKLLESGGVAVGETADVTLEVELTPENKKAPKS